MFDWGILVFDVLKYVMYVWFDVFINYFIGMGWFEEIENKDFWFVSVYIIGKDIIWFYCVIWLCMLWSVGLLFLKMVFGYGFVIVDDG